MRYWDSSALVALYVEEARSDEVRAIAADDMDVSTWALSDIEVRSAIARLVRENVVPPSAIRQAKEEAERHWAAIDVIATIEPVVRRARRLIGVHSLRAADAIQLAAAMTAVQDHTSGRIFVTLDDRLRLAAEREGFIVLP